jgi:hypothetical protein
MADNRPSAGAGLCMPGGPAGHGKAFSPCFRSTQTMHEGHQKYLEQQSMESQERTIGSLDIENGLTVYFIDGSSPPVAGRCQVRLVIWVPMQPIEDHFSNYPEPSQALSRFISLAGPGPVGFRAVKVRNFISREEVENKLDEIKNDFIQTSLEYLKKPCFAAKFIARRYEELCEKAALRCEYEAALKKHESK